MVYTFNHAMHHRLFSFGDQWIFLSDHREWMKHFFWTLQFRNEIERKSVSRWECHNTTRQESFVWVLEFWTPISSQMTSQNLAVFSCDNIDLYFDHSIDCTTDRSWGPELCEFVRYKFPSNPLPCKPLESKLDFCGFSEVLNRWDGVKVVEGSKLWGVRTRPFLQQVQVLKWWKTASQEMRIKLDSNLILCFLFPLKRDKWWYFYW